jgi:hypothetical protein
MRRTGLALCLMLAACEPAPASRDTAQEVGPLPVSGLERAAIESGVITDAAKISPVGLFQRRHEAGRDALCVIPGAKGTLRFGLEANFGEELACRGQGSARRAGDKLILRFAGGDRCIIVAQYDGDQVALPGVVDMACAPVRWTRHVGGGELPPDCGRCCDRVARAGSRRRPALQELTARGINARYSAPAGD